MGYVDVIVEGHRVEEDLVGQHIGFGEGVELVHGSSRQCKAVPFCSARLSLSEIWCGGCWDVGNAVEDVIVMATELREAWCARIFELGGGGAHVHESFKHCEAVPVGVLLWSCFGAYGGCGCHCSGPHS